ncbi:MAG: hypothetical protein Kilf2KO_41130 [Rhodospirillales bacterium]
MRIDRPIATAAAFAAPGTAPGQTAGLLILVSDVSSAGEAVDLYISQLDRIAGALEQVKDQASADVAAASIDETVQEMDRLSGEMEGKITPDQWLSAMTQRQQEMTQIQTRISSAMMQIVQKNPALIQRMNASMQGIPTLGN